MHNIKTSLLNTLDLLQFAYRPNHFTDDAISSTLHLALTHLENKDSYVRMQGCVLSPLLFTQLTHDCTAKFSSDHIIKFANDTSVVGLISNNDKTHYRMEVAQLNGVVLATCPSMWVRQRRLWWTSGETRVTTPHWPSTAWLWGKSAALNSWGCISKRTSPGPPTLHHSPRRHNSTHTFSAGWKEQVSLHPSSPLSTGEPLRSCWPAASLSGTGAVVQRTARPSSGQWTPLQRSSVPICPPSWTFSLHDAPVKLPVSWRTPPTPPTVSSSSYHQEDGSGASEPAPPDCSTAFSPRLWEPWTQIPRPSLKPHTNLLPPETWTITHSKHPQTLPHHRKKKLSEAFFMQFNVCYTQVSGPVQNTCSNTFSSIRTGHFLHTTVCT